jgi:hypothetical protein
MVATDLFFDDIGLSVDVFHFKSKHAVTDEFVKLTATLLHSQSWKGRTGIVMFQPSLAQKPWLWLGLRHLWPAQDLGQAKAATHGLALAWPSPGCGFWHVE